MNCSELETCIPDLLTCSLEGPVLAQVQAHLAACEACRSELQDLSELWAQLDVMPPELPGPGLRAGFYTMIEAARASRNGGVRASSRLRRLLLWHPLPLAAAVVLLVAGSWVIGRRTMPVFPGSEAFAASQQVDLDLLKRADTRKRILGVALVSMFPERDPAVPEGLLALLDYDPSVQVRLATVDALYNYADRHRVREALAASLFSQSSPLVQQALVDLLADLRDEDATEALRRLAQDDGTRPEVRERALSALTSAFCNLSPSPGYSLYPARSPRKGRGRIALPEQKPGGERAPRSHPRAPGASRPWYKADGTDSNT